MSLRDDRRLGWVRPRESRRGDMTAPHQRHAKSGGALHALVTHDEITDNTIGGEPFVPTKGDGCVSQGSGLLAEAVNTATVSTLQARR